MSEYIFVTNIFEYSNIRIYSSHSVSYFSYLRGEIPLQQEVCWCRRACDELSRSPSCNAFQLFVILCSHCSNFPWSIGVSRKSKNQVFPQIKSTLLLCHVFCCETLRFFQASHKTCFNSCSGNWKQALVWALVMCELLLGLCFW